MSKKTDKVNNKNENNSNNSYMLYAEIEISNNIEKQVDPKITYSYTSVAKQSTNLSAKLKG